MTVTELFETVATAASEIHGILGERRSYEEGHNPSGERQLAADVYADDLLAERLLAHEAVSTYASEERQSVKRDETTTDGLHISCDPLDGSSNLTSNNAMGTIVGIYDRPLPAPADALVGACYVLYGPITTMVTLGETDSDDDRQVREYIIEDGTRQLLDDDVSIPDDPVTYGFGGRVPDWLPAFATYVESIEGDRLKLRYAGAMVADVNQVLTYGGIFGYPMVEGRPEGKLRLQFEGIPMAAIVAAAGGASTNGTESLLTTDITELHQRSPVFVGNDALISRLERALAE